MANNYRHSGRRVAVASASAALTSGCLVSAASGGSTWLGIDGVYNIPVPASTVKGDRLFVTALTDSAAPTVTRTATGNFKIGVAHSDRDAAGNALVKLSNEQQPAASA
jgi:predicted RecA/RadA family phage recombinase